MFCYISWLHIDRFSLWFLWWDNRKSLVSGRPFASSSASCIQSFTSFVFSLGSVETLYTLYLHLVTICIIHLTFCFVYSNAFTHTPTHTHIHTYMYINVSDHKLFVPNAVLKSLCMLYLSSSLCYIDILCNFPTKMLSSVYNAHKNNNNNKRVIGIAQLSCAKNS